jgi:transposase
MPRFRRRRHGRKTKSISHKPKTAGALQDQRLGSITVFEEDSSRLAAPVSIPKCEECHHWRKRYFLRHEEAQKLEGLLSLRDAQVAELKQQLAKQKGQVKELKRKLYGSTSEQGPVDSDQNAENTNESQQASAGTPEQEPPENEKKKRGKRKGGKGFGPQNHETLPVDEEDLYDIDESCCSECGEQFKPVGEEVSYEVEVKVRAYRRKHRRKKYGHFCKAKSKWVTKRAQGPRRLFPHSTYGISIWAFLLNGKFALHVPNNRLCTLLQQKGLRMPPGTIVAGFSRILILIRPLIAEIRRYSREEKSHWHIDDAGWKTFVKLEGKETYNWHLWVFRSDDVCLYIASPSRAREVPKSHLKDSCGAVSCDRLQSNRKLGDSLEYFFCWVHERRRFRQLLAAYPELRAECEEFLHLIENVFHYNKQRLLLDVASAAQQQAHNALGSALSKIRARIDEHLANPKLHTELRSALKGIKTDWDGLYAFFDQPAIPSHNNPAEQALRGPVVGRNGYYGSGSKSSAELAAAMFSLNATLTLNNVSLEAFLTEYLQACADNGGKPPDNPASFLPWNRRPPPFP